MRSGNRYPAGYREAGVMRPRPVAPFGIHGGSACRKLRFPSAENNESYGNKKIGSEGIAMWKFFAPFLGDQYRTSNKNELAAYASVGAMSLFFWLYHVAVLFYSIYCGLPLLVISNVCSMLICCFSFWYNRNGSTGQAVFLLNVEIAVYCVVNVLLLGWNASVQWLLPASILPCHIVYPLRRRDKQLYTLLLSAAMLICYLLYHTRQPIYLYFNPRALILFNILASIGANGVSIWFNSLGSKATAGYYEGRITSLSNDAYIDSLTGLWNRRYAMEQMRKMTTDPHSSQFSVAMLDVDYFKKINDTYGHPFGDVVLRRLSDALLRHFRSNDIAVRWGGEEFLIILAGATGNQTRAKLEEFRQKVQNMIFEDKDVQIHVTITTGVCEYQSQLSLSETIRRSDVALYHGKKNGRNQVVLYEELAPDAVTQTEGNP